MYTEVQHIALTERHSQREKIKINQNILKRRNSHKEPIVC